MVMEAAEALVKALRESEEYRTYSAARSRAMESERTRVLYREYRRLQVRAQANAVAGRQDESTLLQLRQFGETLQYDEDAAAFLAAEYRVNELLGDLYKMLAKAVDADLSMLEG